MFILSLSQDPLFNLAGKRKNVNATSINWEHFQLHKLTLHEFKRKELVKWQTQDKSKNPAFKSKFQGLPTS